MLAKRIIPCLDIKDGKVVKGINFKDLVVAGDAKTQAVEYERLGADEIVFLDISASLENRKTLIDTVYEVSKNIFIPLTVGGGINSLDDIDMLLKAGADKVSINSAAVKNPLLVKEASKKYGSQCIVVAIDAKYNSGYYEVYTHGGTKPTKLNVVDYAELVQRYGAGEILLTSIDEDGRKNGYDLRLNGLVSHVVSIPVIASGGAGKMEDFKKVFDVTNVSAALAASIFHYKEVNITDLKKYLKSNRIEVRVWLRMNLLNKLNMMIRV